MNKNFLDLKKQILIGVIVKSFLLGLSVGLIVSSGIALAQKLILERVNILLCSLVMAGLLLLVGGIRLLLTFPTDKRVAEKLDNEFSLKEKVQTMLAFNNDKGTMYELQRDDTNQTLGTVKVKNFTNKSIIVFAICILIGIGMVVATLLIPEKVEPPTPPPPTVPFEFTEVQQMAIEEVIAYVKSSEMDEPYRENTANALKTLIEDLKISTTTEARDISLEKAIDTILNENDLSSSAIEIISALWNIDSKTAKILAKAINYYDFPKNGEQEKFIVKITALREAFMYQVSENEKLDEAKRLEETKQLLVSTSEKIVTALTMSKISDSDSLYKVIFKLATVKEENEEFGTRVYGFQTLSTLIDTLGYTDTQRELDNTFTQLNNEILTVLLQQKTNTETGEYAITKICALFSYPIPKFERPILVESSTGDTGDENQSGVSGGIGEGTEYGSDDLVYDPISNKYVEYGVILDKYYELMFGKSENGNYTDEEKLAMEKYFDILYGGFDEEDENTENENTENKNGNKIKIRKD